MITWALQPWISFGIGATATLAYGIVFWRRPSEAAAERLALLAGVVLLAFCKASGIVV